MYSDSPISDENYTINGITNNYGFCIKKSSFHQFIIDIVKQHFTMMPYIKFPQDGVKYSFDAWFEDDNYLVLPTFTDKYVIKDLDIIHKNKPQENTLLYKPTTLMDLIQQKKPNNPNEITIKTITFNSTKCKFKPPIKTNFIFTGTLHEYQKTMIDDMISKFDSKTANGVILRLGCGSGKSCIAINLASHLQVKTLFVTFQCFLIQQLTDEIKKFTNAKVGVIKGQKVDIDDCDFVISSLVSISTIDYDIDFSQFGLVIYDECHHAGSNVFSRSFFKTRSQYMIGLSATPERQDNMLFLLEKNLGKIGYRMEKKINYRIMIKRINFRSDSDKFIPLTTRMAGKKDKVPNNTKMINNLSEIDARNQLILSVLIRLKEIGRKIFVFSSRKKHAILLKQLFDTATANDTDENKYITGMLCGDVNQKHRDEIINTADIIFATQHLAEEALNAPRFNAIILALPFNKKQSSLIQTIGRILRSNVLESYLALPLVIDFVDMLSIYTNWAQNREKVYLRKKWYIQDYYWKDGEYTFNEKNKQFEPVDIMLNDILNEDFIEENLILNGEVDEVEIDSEDEDLGKMYDDIFNT